MSSPLFKALARPVLVNKPQILRGVPVKFMMINFAVSMFVGVLTGALFKSVLLLGGSLHIAVYFLMEENPTIFYQVKAFIKCRFRNFRRGLFGGACYMPVNFRLSSNFNTKKRGR